MSILGGVREQTLASMPLPLAYFLTKVVAKEIQSDRERKHRRYLLKWEVLVSINLSQTYK